MAFAVTSGAQVASAASVAATRGRSSVRRSDAVAMVPAGVSRGRSVSFSPAPAARSRSRSVGAGKNLTARGMLRAAGQRTTTVQINAESGVFDPAEVSLRIFRDVGREIPNSSGQYID